MPSFSTTRRVGVPAAVAYGVAADVGAYQQFLPLLQRSEVRGSKQFENGCEVFEAELTVAYEKLGFRESFVSAVVCDLGKLTVTANSADGPFRAMRTVWSFKPAGVKTDVTIYIDYNMRNPLVQFAVAAAIGMAVEKVMAAFEVRAKALHQGATQPQA